MGMVMAFLLAIMVGTVAAVLVARRKPRGPRPRVATWDELIWGQDGKTYDAEADAEYTRLHRGDQGIQG